MSEDRVANSTPSDTDLQREILAGRKFSLGEAIGRMAGGMMKGESPVTSKRQAEATIEDFLRGNLSDAGGVLGGVLLRRFGQSERLLDHYDQPLTAFANSIHQVLNTEYLLQELVREADVEWGRVFGERPYFERPGCPSDPDDPYTIASVRMALSQLLGKLSGGNSQGSST